MIIARAPLWWTINGFTVTQASYYEKMWKKAKFLTERIVINILCETLNGTELIFIYLIEIGFLPTFVVDLCGQAVHQEGVNFTHIHWIELQGMFRQKIYQLICPPTAVKNLKPNKSVPGLRRTPATQQKAYE